MQINIKKTYLLVIDDDKKCIEQVPALLLIIKGEPLQAMNVDDECRSGILGHEKQQHERTQGSGQAKDHGCTRPDQVPSSHTRTSNGIVYEEKYGGLPLLSGTH